MKKQAEMDEAETRLLLDPYRKMGAFCNPSNHSKNKKIVNLTQIACMDL